MAYIEQFSSQSPSLGARMLELVNAEAVKHAKAYAKYEIDVDSLFSPAASQQQQYGGYGGRARVATKKAVYGGGFNNQAADLDGLNVV